MFATFHMRFCGNTHNRFTRRKMIRNTDSDFNPTMAACEAFDKVLKCVKTSNLNFCLQLSPFSAHISVKKSLIKDKSGFYLTHPDSDATLTGNQNLENLTKKLMELESTIKDLKLRLDESVSDCQRAHDTIHRLENELSIKKEKSETCEFDLKKIYDHELEKRCEEINFLQEENKCLQDQRASLQALHQQHEGQVQDLQRSLQISNNAVKN